MTAITRNPNDNRSAGYFVSNWYNVIVAWQGPRDTEPRILMPWEFLRADDNVGCVDFFNGKTLPNGQPDIERSCAGVTGGLKVHKAEDSSNCKCRNLMLDVEWWVLGTGHDEDVYYYDHPHLVTYPFEVKNGISQKLYDWYVRAVTAKGLPKDRVEIGQMDDPRTEEEREIIRKALL